MDLGEFQAWTRVAPATIEVSVSGSAAEVEQAIAAICALPCPRRKYGRCGKSSKPRAGCWAWCAPSSQFLTLILITAALCLLTTLTAWVLDRRKDFAVMKALGASEGLITGFFAAQAAAIGATGALVGFAAGIGIAMWIGASKLPCRSSAQAGGTAAGAGGKRRTGSDFGHAAGFPAAPHLSRQPC